MPRRPATVTQAEIARAIRAAKQAGASAVQVSPDGNILVLLTSRPMGWDQSMEDVDDGPEVVL